jgi:enoyl-CoA hydratase
LIDLALDGWVGLLTLRNSARRNAMTRAMWRELRAVAQALPAELRCLIVRGEGGHFCAGGDISEYPSFRFDPDELRHFHEEEVAPALEALLALDIPVIAQIEGNCIGGGLEIAACCDIRIAGQSATFGAPIAKLGMPMAPREMAIVLRAAGEASVREVLLEARVLDAQTMLQRGFLHAVVNDDSVAHEVQQRALRVAALSPQAVRLNKQTLRRFLEQNGHFARMESMQNAMKSVVNQAFDPYTYADSAQHREGIQAFIDKRVAKF